MQPLYIGKTRRGEEVELTLRDLRTHVHGIGASRTGKSKLIESMARELVLTGQGFCLIDPEGTTYRDVLRWLTYEATLAPLGRPIILLDPSYEGRVVGFNPFKRRERGDVGVQADNLVDATLKAWNARNTDATPLLGEWLGNVYALLLEEDLPVDAARHLVNWMNQDVRRSLVEALPDDELRHEWQELLAAKTAKEFTDRIGSTKRRLSRFIKRTALRRILNCPMAIDLDRIIARGSILLVNLAPRDGMLSLENARLLGTLLVNEVWKAALRRELREDDDTLPEPPWHVFIDEFQAFITPDCVFRRILIACSDPS